MRLCRALLLRCLLLALVLPVAALAAEPLPARGSVEALFTPWDDAEGALLRTIGEAKKNIYVQAFLLTSRNIARALTEAHRRIRQAVSLKVRGLTVKPQLPPDLLGLLVLQPLVEEGRGEKGGGR